MYVFIQHETCEYLLTSKVANKKQGYYARILSRLLECYYVTRTSLYLIVPKWCPYLSPTSLVIKTQTPSNHVSQQIKLSF